MKEVIKDKSMTIILVLLAIVAILSFMFWRAQKRAEQAEAGRSLQITQKKSEERQKLFDNLQEKVKKSEELIRKGNTSDPEKFWLEYFRSLEDQ